MNGEFMGGALTPPDIRTCLVAGSLGMRCAGCELAPCDIQEAGATIQQQQENIDDQQRTITLQEEKIEVLERQWLQAVAERDEERRQRLEEQKDPVIPDFLTVTGVRARIKEEPQLAQEFLSGKVGIIYIDLRGLHARNEALGDFAGDYDLCQAAIRLTSAHRGLGESEGDDENEIPDAEAETGTDGVEESSQDAGGLRLETTAFRDGVPGRALARRPERRAHPSTIRDIGYRGTGADELVVLVRSVDPEQLRGVAARVEELFSVHRAMQDSEDGKLPLVATVAHAHVDDLPLEYTKPHDIFQAIHDEVRLRHQHLKREQYGEMWNRARRAAQEQGKRLRKPDDPRLIFQYFVDYCCPVFADNAVQFYESQGVTVKPQPPSPPVVQSGK